jgi:biopolymer transport protein ExbD
MFLEDYEQEDAPDIGLTPLIDVVFQLLLFFMLTSTFAAPAMEIALPRMDAAAPAEEAEQVTVGLDSAGRLQVDGSEVTEAGLGRALEASMTRAGTRAVFLRADGDVPYEKVLQLMRSLGEAGCAHINFVYEAAE